MASRNIQMLPTVAVPSTTLRRICRPNDLSYIHLLLDLDTTVTNTSLTQNLASRCTPCSKMTPTPSAGLITSASLTPFFLAAVHCKFIIFPASTPCPKACQSHRGLRQSGYLVCLGT